MHKGKNFISSSERCRMKRDSCGSRNPRTAISPSVTAASIQSDQGRGQTLLQSGVDGLRQALPAATKLFSRPGTQQSRRKVTRPFCNTTYPGGPGWQFRCKGRVVGHFLAAWPADKGFSNYTSYRLARLRHNAESVERRPPRNACGGAAARSEAKRTRTIWLAVGGSRNCPRNRCPTHSNSPASSTGSKCS